MFTQIISATDHNDIVQYLGSDVSKRIDAQTQDIIYDESSLAKIDARGISLDAMCQSLFSMDGYDYFNELVPLRIYSIVSEEVKSRPHNLIDFKTDLLEDIALDKRVTRRQSDYRPEYAYYYLFENETIVDYARRRIEFEIAPSGLMLSRSEYLSYYRVDGQLGPEFKIKNKTYDHTDVDELAEAIFEQTRLRTDIINHLKGTIMGVVQAMNPTFTVPDIIAATLPFFNEYATERVDYIEIGSPLYANSVAAIDLAATSHTYLGAPVAPGVTLRNYIVSMTS